MLQAHGRTRPRLLAPCLLGVLLLLVAGCSAGSSTRSGGKVVVERDTLGDTLVVRTVSGSVWGADRVLVPEMSIGETSGDTLYLFGRISGIAPATDGRVYVLDGQGPVLREYGPHGRYVATLGRAGAGPGELKQPDGGLAVLSDGRLLVRDPGNTRIQVYGPEGKPLATWPARGGFFTSDPLYRGTNDHVYTQVLTDPQARVDHWVIGLVDIDSSGVAHDTLIPPSSGFKAPSVEATGNDGKSMSRNSVPFSPQEMTTLDPDGFWIHAISTDYRIDLLRTDAPPIRIERAYDPVPVTPGEKAQAEASTTRNMRMMDPNWKWNGPSIPDHKPPFVAVFVGRTGRIWVEVSMPGIEEDNPDYDPKKPDSEEKRWRQPVAFDVFRPDGTYLGRVHAPTGFSVYPTPVFDGDRVWAVTHDDMGVERVVRFAVRADTASTPDGGSGG